MMRCAGIRVGTVASLLITVAVPLASMAEPNTPLAEPNTSFADPNTPLAEPNADDFRVQQTAVRALRWAFFAKNGYRWEYGGILVTHEGELGYSAFPDTLKKLDAVEIDVEKQRTPGDTLVGLYHTHPCNSKEYYPQYFSPQDLISAFYWKVPTFILDECTGKVHEFDPALDRVADTGTVVMIEQKNGTQRRVRLPAGRIVGDIGEAGPDLAAIEELMERKMY